MKNIFLYGFLAFLIFSSLYIYFSVQKYNSLTRVNSQFTLFSASQETFQTKKAFPSMAFDADIELTYCPVFIEKQHCRVHIFKNKVLIVNFWASWCKPCVEEMPSLLEFARGMDPKRFAVVLVSVDEDLEAANAMIFSQAKEQSVFMVWDKDKKFSSKFGIEKYPETFFVNRKLEVINKINGAVDWARPDILEYLKSLPQ